ncbi:aldo/keto reductase [Planctomycetota bacterium]
MKEKLTKTFTLGRTGIEVGGIGFGALQIASKLGKRDSARLVHYALEKGITFFDTARGYMDSEIKLGQALKGKKRGQAVIMSKTGSADKKTFITRMDESLERLNTDYIDFYMFHGIDREKQYKQIFGKDDLLSVMCKAQKSGKIRFVGFSSHVPEIAKKCIETGVFDVVLYPLSFMNREARSKGVLKAARENNTAFLAMKPFGGGRIHRADWAIEYIKQVPDVLPVIGFESSGEIDEVIRLYQNKSSFSEKEKKEMELFRRRVGLLFCRGCGYCMPCPQDIPINKVTFWPVIYEQMGAKKSINDKLLQAVEQARSCTECRKCVEKCPYSLDIPRMLAKNSKRILEVRKDHK